jgi:hypothetical protein
MAHPMPTQTVANLRITQASEHLHSGMLNSS